MKKLRWRPPQDRALHAVAGPPGCEGAGKPLANLLWRRLLRVFEGGAPKARACSSRFSCSATPINGHKASQRKGMPVAASSQCSSAASPSCLAADRSPDRQASQARLGACDSHIIQALAGLCALQREHSQGCGFLQLSPEPGNDGEIDEALGFQEHKTGLAGLG